MQLICAFAIAWVYGGKKAFQQITRNKVTFRWVMGIGAMRGLAAVLFIFAQVYSNNIAVVSVISNFKIIVIAIFGALILKEHKFFIHKITTASMAVWALALMLRT